MKKKDGLKSKLVEDACLGRLLNKQKLQIGQRPGEDMSFHLQRGQ